jgi:Flp pilus assembly protein TadG
MRVKLSPRRYNADGDEQGAVAVIVALSLIALIGMIVLVVDVGGLLYRRRQMVSASDAAALAAARSCALGAVEAGAPEVKADEFAGANLEGIALTGGILPGETVGCETDMEGYVTVQYSSDHDLWFAGIFGATSKPVVTKATAEWGGATTGLPVPFVVGMDQSNQGNIFCKDPDGNLINVPPEDGSKPTCAVWFDNGSEDGYFGGFQESVFGSLNLNQWDVPNPAVDCLGSKDLPDNIEYAENGGYNGEDPLDPINYPDPTWVCVGDGGNTSLYDGFAITKNTKVMVFPATDGQVVERNGKIVAYNVIGFTALKLIELYKINELPPTSGDCEAVRPMIAGSAFNLDFLASNEGCYSGVADAITNVKVVKDRNNQPGPQPAENVDWTFNPTTHWLNWNAAGPAAENQPYKITFDWQQDGPCGPQPSNASGFCMIVQWDSFQFGNGGSGGINLGVLGTRLCDLTIAGSCEATG